MYGERYLLKYDTETKGYRFGDVIDLVHPTPAADKSEQGELFAHALDRRHQRDKPIPRRLAVLHARARLTTSLPVDARRSVLLAEDGHVRLKAAGMTWEALAGWLQGPLDAAAWEAIIPSMGYMALLRNLRNFDQAGVSDEVASGVATKLSDPNEVAAARQLPFRFLSAYRAARSVRWAWPLERALGHALDGLPALSGSTLILVDTSGSMNAGFSRDGTLMRWDAAALFGIALAVRARTADLVSFSAGIKPFDLGRGESVLAALGRWKDGGWFLSGGTNTAACLRASYSKHDRVVIVTDEQAAYDPAGVTASVPSHVPVYTWNLAGYRVGHAPSGGANRHTFGGLNDQAFRMIPLLEDRVGTTWPF